MGTCHSASFFVSTSTVAASKRFSWISICSSIFGRLRTAIFNQRGNYENFNRRASSKRQFNRNFGQRIRHCLRPGHRMTAFGHLKFFDFHELGNWFNATSVHPRWHISLRNAQARTFSIDSAIFFRKIPFEWKKNEIPFDGILIVLNEMGEHAEWQKKKLIKFISTQFYEFRF